MKINELRVESNSEDVLIVALATDIDGVQITGPVAVLSNWRIHEPDNLASYTSLSLEDRRRLAGLLCELYNKNARDKNLFSSFSSPKET